MVALLTSRPSRRAPSGSAGTVSLAGGPYPRSGCTPVLSFEGRPGGLAVGPDGAIYVTDKDSAVIWRVRSDGLASRLVTSKRRDGPTDDRLHAPAGLAVRSDGTLVVADYTSHRVCTVDPSGRVQLLAGEMSGFRDGSGRQAMFRFPRDVTIGPDDVVYVADSGNDRIRTITRDGQVTTLAGSIFDYGDGKGPHGRFRRPASLTTDPRGGLFVADTGNNAVRRVSPEGEVTTLAGRPPGGAADGVGGTAGLRWPTGIAVGPDGALWVADFGNSAVRRIRSGGETSTFWEVPGSGWPAAVGALGDGRVAIAGSLLDASRQRSGCLMILG